MSDYMKEMERLADEYATAVSDGRDDDCIRLRAALLAHAGDYDEQKRQADFYSRRCNALQKWQSRMRDPERTVVCDILANGYTLPPEIAGNRYAAQADRAVSGVPVETTEVPVPEPDLLIRGFRDVAVHSKTLIRAYGDAREAAGYARGRAEPGGALESAQQRAEYWKSEYCAANAEIDKLCADLAASQAECERMRIPIGWKPAPFEPTAEMLDVAVSHALTVQISGEYNWSAYMRDVWMRMWSQIGAQSIPRAALAGEVKP